MPAQGKLVETQSTLTNTIKCGICDGDEERYKRIQLLLAAGIGTGEIERQMRAAGMVVKRETVRRHFVLCLGSIRPDSSAVTRALAGRDREHLRGDDFAVMIRGEAIRMLREGSLRIKTSDGLWAQALIDKRVEKAADRDLMLNMARLLSGGKPPPEVIVGYRVLDGEHPDSSPRD